METIELRPFAQGEIDGRPDEQAALMDRSRTWHWTNVVTMKRAQQYQAASIAVLAGWLADHPDEETRWRLIAEFLEEYRHEPSSARVSLLSMEPPCIGDSRWDVFLAALAEHLAARDGAGAPRGPRPGGSGASGFPSTLPPPAWTPSFTHPRPSVAVVSSSTRRSWRSRERRPSSPPGCDRGRFPAPR
jgi:hypothetical protein